MAHGETPWSKHPETRAIRAAVEAARRMTNLLAAGHTPRELGYPAELAAKEIVRREWRAWYDANKSLGR